MGKDQPKDPTPPAGTQPPNPPPPGSDPPIKPQIDLAADLEPLTGDFAPSAKEEPQPEIDFNAGLNSAPSTSTSAAPPDPPKKKPKKPKDPAKKVDPFVEAMQAKADEFTPPPKKIAGGYTVYDSGYDEIDTKSGDAATVLLDSLTYWAAQGDGKPSQPVNPVELPDPPKGSVGPATPEGSLPAAKDAAARPSDAAQPPPGSPVGGAGGPAVKPSPKGLGDLARYAIAATIVAALGLGAFIFLGNKGPAPVSTAVPSVTGTLGPAATPGGSAAGPVVTPAATAGAATAAPGAPVVIFTDMGESNAPALDECQGSSGTYKDPRNRYSFTITVAELGNAQATQIYADRLLGRPAVLTLVGPPDEGVYTATIEQGFGGNLALNFDGIECKPDGFSSLGSLTVEGLALELQASGLRMGPLPE